MEKKNARQRQQGGAQCHRDRISALPAGPGLPADLLALRLADLKRQLALRQAMA